MIVPVKMPGIASGNTWWNTACIFEAPTPSAASRMLGGTAFSEARVEMMIVGSVISVSTSPPTIGADCGKCMNWMNTARPKIPNTMEGTAARFEMFTSIKSVTCSAVQTPQGRWMLPPQSAGTGTTPPAS
jgi:hypothetical protein